ARAHQRRRGGARRAGRCRRRRRRDRGRAARRLIPGAASGGCAGCWVLGVGCRRQAEPRVGVFPAVSEAIQPVGGTAGRAVAGPERGELRAAGGGWPVVGVGCCLVVRLSLAWGAFPRCRRPLSLLAAQLAGWWPGRSGASCARPVAGGRRGLLSRRQAEPRVGVFPVAVDLIQPVGGPPLGPARPDTAQPDTARPDTAQPDTARPDPGTARRGRPRSGRAGARKPRGAGGGGVRVLRLCARSGPCGAPHTRVHRSS
ncbi:MAG: hypothetical protein K0S49_1439, partial [Microbacterium sp.]|nr:hypothetical protein [Microbacterium sp.]